MMNPRPFLAVLGLLSGLVLTACQTQSNKPSITFPIGSEKIWPDTTASAKVESYTVDATLRKGTIFVSIPQNFGKGWNHWRWDVSVIRKSPKQMGVVSDAAADDSDNDGVPDHLDWCPSDSGLVENNGCPEGEEGSPPIIWSDAAPTAQSDSKHLSWVTLLKLEDNEEMVSLSLGYYPSSGK